MLNGTVSEVGIDVDNRMANTVKCQCWFLFVVDL